MNSDRLFDVFKESVIYRIYLWVLRTIYGSRFVAVLSGIGRWISSGFFGRSNTASLQHTFAPSESHTDSLVVRVSTFFDKLRDRIYPSLYRAVRNSLAGSACIAIARAVRSLCRKPSVRDSRTYRAVRFLIKEYLGTNPWIWPLIVLTLFPFIDYFFRYVVVIDLVAAAWDEGLMLLCLLLAGAMWLAKKKDTLIKSNPMHKSFFFFLLLCIFLLILGKNYYRIVNIEGFRAVVQHTLWFFVAYELIRSKADCEKIIRGMIFTTSALALHGIYQYIVKVPIPDNWVDRLEGFTGTRVFSIIGSPNILGSMMALLIIPCLAYVYNSDKLITKLMYLGLTGCMGLCLIFTGSRSAQISAGLALVLFAIITDRRLLIAIAAGVPAIFIAFPSLLNRFTYLFSSAYLDSSAKGGRIIRWTTGMNHFTSNPWFGMGYGRFGGAVAQNNKWFHPDTIYLDNWWLKTAVEMGVVGLVAFAVLFFCLFRNTHRLGKLAGWQTKDGRLISSVYCGMFAIIVHNFTENIFEVPMMVIFFWLFAAVAMSLYSQRLRAKEDLRL